MSLFESSDKYVTVYDTNEWVRNNKADFKPPICNKCMFSDQLKVFFVGGPNSRLDYHLEEGDEIFFQIKGHMVLKVIEHGIHKDIRICEGELFLLPAYVEHSPQRFEDSLGCVVERDRNDNEFDCVRYFVGETNEILWERWFNLKDVVEDLPPIIRKFNESEAKATQRPTSDSFVLNAPYKPHDISLPKPINLSDYIDQHLEEINTSKLAHSLFMDIKSRTKMYLYGIGVHELQTQNSEMVLLFQRGEGELIYDKENTIIKAFYTTRVKPNCKFTLKIEDGVCLTAQILPNEK